MSAKKGPKKGSIAIPFLMTVLVTLVLVGGTAFFFLHLLTGDKDKESSYTDFTSEFKPGPEYNRTLLAVLENGDLDTDVVFVLIRSIPQNLKLVTMVVPTSVQIPVDSTAISLVSIYRAEGIEKTCRVLETQLGITIDKYAKLDYSAMERIHNILGGVTVTVPEGIPDMAAGKVGLNARQMISLLTYPDFAGGERYRTSFANTLISTMLNYGLRDFLVSRMDISFEGLVDLLSTNITALDYQNDKKAFIYLLENRTEGVQIRILPGEWLDDDTFALASNTAERIREWFEISAVPAQ